jgi:dihydrofolate reductase
MGRIVVTEYMTLDGVIEALGGVEDFRHVNWAMDFTRGPAGEEFKLEETRESEALLLGRVTYEGFAIAWPTMEGEFADKFNAMPKYVVSSTLENPEWNYTTVLEGDGSCSAPASAWSARRRTRSASRSPTHARSATASRSSCISP